MPDRVQLSRRKGWRMPPNTVSVARPTVYGNPYRVGRDGTAEECVAKFRADIERDVGGPIGIHRALMRTLLAKLRGKNLACWCPLCDAHKAGKPFGVECSDCSPCHSDVLGDLANPADACGDNHA